MIATGPEPARRAADPAPSPALAGAAPWGGLRTRLPALLLTALILGLLLRRVPLERLLAVLRTADYVTFLLLMVPNTVFYFCWDTLVLATVVRWFHRPLPYRELLPARAVSYVAGLFNTHLGRGALALYLARRTGAGLLPVAGTVLFLLLTEYLHLVSWTTLALAAFGRELPRGLLWAPPMVAVVWLATILVTRRTVIARLSQRRGPWSLLRTLSLAPARRYLQVVLLRAPAFLVSLFIHYLAAHAFGVHIPLPQMLAFLPVIFMVAALPVTVGHLGTTQAAWMMFFGHYAPAEALLAFSLAAHATFTTTRAALGLVFVPRAYADLVAGAGQTEPAPATA